MKKTWKRLCTGFLVLAKSKRTMLNIIPFVLSIIVVSSIFFLCRTSSKDEIVSESIHYWISISAMLKTEFLKYLNMWKN